MAVRRIRAGVWAGVAIAAGVVSVGCTTQTPPKPLSVSCTGEGAARSGAPAVDVLDPGPGLRERPTISPARIEAGSFVTGLDTSGRPVGHIGGGAGEVTAVRLDTGERLWHVDAVPGAQDRPLTTIVPVPGHPGVLAAEIVDGGDTLRIRHVDTTGAALRVCAITPQRGSDHATVTADGEIVLATRTTRESAALSGSEGTVSDRVVEARSARDGDLLWKRRATGFAYDGTRVYTRLGRELHALDPVTGDVVWHADAAEDLGDPREGGDDPLFVAADRVYAWSEQAGTIVAHDTADGRPAWRIAATGPLRAVERVGGDRVILTHDQGATFAGPTGLPVTVAAPYTEPLPGHAPGDGANSVTRELVDVTPTATGGTATYLERSPGGRHLLVTGDSAGLREAPARFPVAPDIAGATVAGDIAYVLTAGERPTLIAHDVTAAGAELWRVALPTGSGTRTVIEAFPGGVYVVAGDRGVLLR